MADRSDDPVCMDCGMSLKLERWQIDWVLEHGNPIPRPPCPVNASGRHRVDPQETSDQ